MGIKVVEPEYMLKLLNLITDMVSLVVFHHLSCSLTDVNGTLIFILRLTTIVVAESSLSGL